MKVKQIVFPITVGLVSSLSPKQGTKRLVRQAFQYAIDNDRTVCDARP